MEKSQVMKRSVVVGGHKTSISLEEPFWKGLKDIALERRQTLSELISSLDTQRKFSNLSSTVRLFVLMRQSVFIRMKCNDDILLAGVRVATQADR